MTEPKQGMRQEPFFNTVNHYRRMISEAFLRMATNMEDTNYQATQMKKVNGWLEELSRLYNEYQEHWVAYMSQAIETSSEVIPPMTVDALLHEYAFWAGNRMCDKNPPINNSPQAYIQEHLECNGMPTEDEHVVIMEFLTQFYKGDGAITVYTLAQLGYEEYVKNQED